MQYVGSFQWLSEGMLRVTLMLPHSAHVHMYSAYKFHGAKIAEFFVHDIFSAHHPGVKVRASSGNVASVIRFRN